MSVEPYTDELIYGRRRRDTGIHANDCRRGCCWTPFGHSVVAINCTCHNDKKEDS